MSDIGENIENFFFLLSLIQLRFVERLDSELRLIRLLYGFLIYKCSTRWSYMVKLVQTYRASLNLSALYM